AQGGGASYEYGWSKPPMIEVQNITKRYGDFTAIGRVTFTVDKGEVLAFLGPNGAGKTTAMRILTCFMPATEGVARVAGFDCFDQPIEVKRRIGYLPEHPPLYQELTVTEYLTFVGRIKGMGAEDLRSGLDRVMERLALGDVRHRLIANLSRGYQQRVGLAQALLHDPRDELARFVVDNGWGLLELKTVSMTLEDVFLRLTQHEEGLE